MRKLIAAISLMVTMIISVSCAAREAVAPPALLKPATVKADTALVTRGDVVRISQLKGFIRVYSEKLFYGDTGLRFGEYFCVSGQQVEKGQLLARLDVEDLTEQITSQEEEIERIKKENAFEIASLELDIDIAQVEVSSLTRAAAQFDENAMQAVERKKMEVESRRLALSQAQERHALSLQYATDYLGELLTKAEEAEMRAPFDGVITYRAEKAPGDYVEPFMPLIYISDGQNKFVEYANMTPVTVLKNYTIKGYVGEKEYELDRIVLSTQDMFYYANLNLLAPIRFTVVNPDEQLMPGTFMNIHMYEGLAADVLRIPVNALFNDTELGYYVYVMENGQKLMRTVEVGLRSDAFIEVKSGLQEGEEVYVK